MQLLIRKSQGFLEKWWFQARAENVQGESGTSGLPKEQGRPLGSCQKNIWVNLKRLPLAQGDNLSSVKIIMTEDWNTPNICKWWVYKATYNDYKDVPPPQTLRAVGLVGPLLPATGPYSTTQLQKVSFPSPQSSRKKTLLCHGNRSPPWPAQCHVPEKQ